MAKEHEISLVRLYRSLNEYETTGIAETKKPVITITPEQERACRRLIESAIEFENVRKRIVDRNFPEVVYSSDICVRETEESWDAILIVNGKPYTLYSYNKTEKEKAPESNLENEVEEIRSFLADKGVYV